MSSQDEEKSKTRQTSLPEHLWIEVFEWGVASEGGTKPRVLTREFVDSCRYVGVNAAVDSHAWPFPWNLTFVSSTWRKLATEAAPLWTDIHIIVPPHVKPPVSRSALVSSDLQLILDRSKKTPLRLDTSCLTRKASDSVWALINAHKDRYITWNLSWRPDKDLRDLVFTKRLLRQWSSLTSLEVEFEASTRDAPALVDFSFLPRLQTYKERGSWKSQTAVKLPLFSLECITLQLPLGFISARLGPAPMLRCLVVEVRQQSQWLTLNTLGITNEYYYKRLTYWPSLEEATIQNCSFLLRFCEGSPLRYLRIYDYPETGSMQALGGICRGAIYSLRELTLWGELAWTDEVARQGITALMRIEHLHITFRASKDDIWSLIDNGVGERFWASGLLLLLQELLVTPERVPCPNLRTLEVTFDIEGEVSVPTWHWLRECSQGFVHTVGEAVGLVWESRLPENNKACSALDSCSFTVLGGPKVEVFSDVKLLTIES